MPTPQLSIVVCGRNDDYGVTFKARFQTFLRHLGALDDTRKALFELIVVEWNPPPDTQPLARAFDWSGLEQTARIITVPPDAHDAIPNPSGMPLLEFWSKNVGVRRARAPYVLSTNPDIVLAPAFFDFVSSGKLSPQAFYRADRYDFAPHVAFEAPGDQVFALAQQAVFEAHTRNPVDPEEPMSHLVDPAEPIEVWPQSQPVYGDTLSDHGAIIVSGKRRDPLSGLHTQASGDFVMASRHAWEAVRGHWERTDTFTHLDSYLICHLHAAGYRQHILRRPIMVLHMDHAREEQKSRPIRPYAETLAEIREAAAGELPNPNDANWGLADKDLPEARPACQPAPPRAPVAAAAKSISLASHLKQLARAQALAAAQHVTDLRKQSALERQVLDLRAQLDNAFTACRDAQAAADAVAPDAAAPQGAPDDDAQQRELEIKLAQAESCRAATTSVLEQVSRERDELHVALSAERVVSAETLAQVDALARSIAQLQNDVEGAHKALRDATASHAAERAVADSRYDELVRQFQYLRTEELAQLRAAHEQRVSQLRAEAGDAHAALSEANIAHAVERAAADARYDELVRQMEILRTEELAHLRATHAEQSAQLRQALQDAERIAQQLDADRDLHVKAAARAFQELETERAARQQEAERAERLLAAERDLAAAQQRAIQELQARREAAEGLARALEHEGLAREQRVAALESALAEAQQAAAEAEAARDTALATYKAIVDNSRYLKARRAIIRLLKGTG